MDVSEYDSSTGSITLSGSFTLDTYAKEISKLLYANSRNDAVPGNRIFELTINDGKEGGVSAPVQNSIYVSFADQMILTDQNDTEDRSNVTQDQSIDGWLGNDDIKTGSGDDEIYGGEGNDQIDGGSGNDTIFGQQGNDSINGGSGDDFIYGQEGNDLIYASAGYDILSGGDGIDTASFELLTSGIRADLAFGEIYTNEDTDSIYEIVNFVVVEFDEVKTYNFELLIGTNYDDVIIAADHTAMEYIGGDGDDEIFGGAQDEVLEGGLGSDTLFGGAGQDVLKGGEGSDVFGLTGEDQGLDIIKDFSTGDIVDLTRLGIGSKDELSFKEGTLTVNDYTYSGTILSRVDPQELSETALFLFENENHDAFTTNNPLEHIII